MLLKMREENCDVIVKDLRKQTDFCMLTLGTNTIPAVKLIQNAYRRYLFRKKLYTMHLCYLNYLKEREEIICNYLRIVLRTFSSKLKKSQLEFFRYRVVRLEQIKRNLAILVVKKIWKSKKFTVKIIKEKFIRIKRRKAAMQNKEAYEKYLASIGGGKKDIVKKQVDNESKESNESPDDKKEEKQGENKEENPEEDEEYKEAQRIKDIIEQKIKEKVAMSKLAYALTIDTKPKVIFPLMQEKALNESLDVDALQSKLFHMTASNFAKGRCLTRSKGETTRNYMISSPRPVSQRKYIDKAILPPLWLLQPPSVPLTPALPVNIRIAENEGFLESTISSQNKTEPPVIPDWKKREFERLEQKKQARKFKKMQLDFINSQEITSEVKRITREIKPRERNNHWIPVARRFSNYVTGVDNSSYIPAKWTPLPLNKRILSTAMTTISTRGQNSPITPQCNIDIEAISFSDSVRQRKFFREHIANSDSPSTKEHSGNLIL
ncbi:hypothetical protein SteCoe_25989 [Stentor coeruleus]|uniref:Uncharacterized protein n=1 Tax=Stentor coeruleus TaxID=5963 RepID=A0A1R2BDY0_9CILI|nr:hypothetical protein SteCoe_25989 [Stentor coeruleus]